MIFFLDKLSDELIYYILKFNTQKCVDCSNVLYERIKKCPDCTIQSCHHHSKHRFAFSNSHCNNCYFWRNGLPALAKGSTEW